ncbi:hypothetical protein LEMLEM_LOCUS7839 [Lemmus lemmus]
MQQACITVGLDCQLLQVEHLAGAKLPADPASQEPGKHSHIQPPQDRVSHPRTPRHPQSQLEAVMRDLRPISIHWVPQLQQIFINQEMVKCNSFESLARLHFRVTRTCVSVAFPVINV